ncbi:hypothetical protein EYV94_18095 [Puteibacter caeruleilacunae]|nr:hypothetical protein EYV94_18095 [Puteibacter caeruleilacunae]
MKLKKATLKKLKTFGPFVLLAILAFTSIRYYSYYKHAQSAVTLISEQENEAIRMIHKASRNFNLQTETELRKIPNNIDMFDAKGNKYNLDDFLSEKPILIFRYSNSSYYQKCINQQIKHLNKLNTKKDKTNIIILASTRDRNTESFSKFANSLKVPIFRIATNALNISAENQKLPFLFILNNDHMVKHFYIPDYPVQTVTDNYYNSIEYRYFREQ